MTKRCLVSTLLLSTVLIVPACGSESGDGDGDTSSDSSGDGDGEAGTGDTGTEASTDGSTSDTTGDGDGDTTSDTTGDGDGDTTSDTTGDGDSTTDTTGGDGDTGSGDCMAWEIVYDLTGSEFEITDTPFNGAGDKIVPLETPYDGADTIGPGELTLMISDNNGAPGDGTAFLVDYAVTMNFQTGSGGTALVTQTLEITTANECGSAVGSLSGTALSWSPNALNDYHTEGTLNCQGTFCGSFGAPPAGDTPVNQTTNIDPFSAFTFSNDLMGFTAPDFTTSSDSNATTLMDLVGTETSRQLVAAPACFCE